jgi:hypothetical protein
MGHTRETVVTVIGDEEYKNLVKRVAAQTHVALSKVSEMLEYSMNREGL